MDESFVFACLPFPRGLKAYAPQDVLEDLEEVLLQGASFNLYMFHGGTNWGFTTGSLMFPASRPQYVRALSPPISSAWPGRPSCIPEGEESCPCLPLLGAGYHLI